MALQCCFGRIYGITTSFRIASQDCTPLQRTKQFRKQASSWITTSRINSICH
uniref:Uncharacterized protein n=1 Tax=Arundo donax TaxID=35708 RepID=A0A0A8YG91_ARUDO